MTCVQCAFPAFSDFHISTACLPLLRLWESPDIIYHTCDLPTDILIALESSLSTPPPSPSSPPADDAQFLQGQRLLLLLHPVPKHWRTAIHNPLQILNREDAITHSPDEILQQSFSTSPTQFFWQQTVIFECAHNVIFYIDKIQNILIAILLFVFNQFLHLKSSKKTHHKDKAAFRVDASSDKEPQAQGWDVDTQTQKTVHLGFQVHWGGSVWRNVQGLNIEPKQFFKSWGISHFGKVQHSDLRRYVCKRSNVWFSIADPCKQTLPRYHGYNRKFTMTGTSIGLMVSAKSLAPLSLTLPSKHSTFTYISHARASTTVSALFCYTLLRFTIFMIIYDSCSAFNLMIVFLPAINIY